MSSIHGETAITKPPDRRRLSFTCDHIVMDRIFTREACHQCWKRPEFGILYVCRHDEITRGALANRSNEQDGAAATAAKESIDPPRIDSADSGVCSRANLESVGLSESIIRQAEEGHYTQAQLSHLVFNKLCARQAIREVRENKIYQETSDDEFSVPANSLFTFHPRKARGRCSLKCCHTCRPGLEERIYASVEEVLQMPPLNLNDTHPLPICNAQILRKLDPHIQKPLQNVSWFGAPSIAWTTTQSDLSTTTTTSSPSDRQQQGSSKKQIRHKNSFLRRRKGGPSSRSGRWEAGDPAAAATGRETADSLSTLFADIHLDKPGDTFRSVMRKGRNLGKSVFTRRRSQEVSPSSSSSYHRRSRSEGSESSVGEGKAVGGGGTPAVAAAVAAMELDPRVRVSLVSLTEESAETHTPDVITQV